MTHVQAEQLRRVLKEFAPDADRDANWSNPASEHRVDLRGVVSPEPFTVFIIFVYLLQYPFWGKSEKTAWEIPVLYQRTPILFAHRKFGFRAYSQAGDSESQQRVLEAITLINRAIPLAEKLIQPTIRVRVDSGQFSLRNDNALLRRRYRVFRTRTEYCFKKQEQMLALPRADRQHPDFFRRLHAYSQRAGTYVPAMLDAYFSWLEHILVLVVPFLTPNKHANSLSKFIALTWSDKYKELFPVQSDPTNKRLYDSLLYVKERFRNPYSHGNFDKKGSSFHVHMQHLGAIPMLLSKTEHGLHFGLGASSLLNFTDICSAFDSFDSYLSTGPARFAMQYIRSGLDIAFDRESRLAYAAASSSMRKFRDFLQMRNYYGEHEVLYIAA